MEKLPLNIVNRLPIRVKRIDYNYKYYLIEDLNNTYFHLYEASNKEYLIYYELLKSKAIQRTMFEFKTKQCSGVLANFSGFFPIFLL